MLPIKWSVLMTTTLLVLVSISYGQAKASQGTSVSNNDNARQLPEVQRQKLLSYCQADNVNNHVDKNDEVMSCLQYEVFRMEQRLKRNNRIAAAAIVRDHNLPDTRLMKVPADIDRLPQYHHDVKGQYAWCKSRKKWYQAQASYDAECHRNTRKSHQATKAQWYNEHGHMAYW